MTHSAGEIPVFERILQDFSRARGVDLDAQAVVYNLYRAATDVFARLEAGTLQPHGLTHAGFVLLMALRTAGAREVRELAAFQRVSRPAIVSAVGTLERAGLVKRVRSDVDRRLVRVELTPSGRALIDRVHVLQHRFERRVSQVLTRREQQTLAAWLRRIGRAAVAATDAERTVRAAPGANGRKSAQHGGRRLLAAPGGRRRRRARRPPAMAGE